MIKNVFNLFFFKEVEIFKIMTFFMRHYKYMRGRITRNWYDFPWPYVSWNNYYTESMTVYTYHVMYTFWNVHLWTKWLWVWILLKYLKYFCYYKLSHIPWEIKHQTYILRLNACANICVICMFFKWCSKEDLIKMWFIIC